MREIDLHCHTNKSDGAETPRSAAEHAKALGVRAIAITDHDTVDGIKEAQSAGEELGVEVIGGIELGCGYMGKEIHMLGYFIDPDSEHLRLTLKRLVDDRDERNEKMAAALRADGLNVSVEELRKKHPGSIIGRPHMALCLIEAGLAVSVKDAFERYLDPGRKYYIRRHFLEIDEGAELIRAAGGVPVLAHPRQYKKTPEELDRLLGTCAAAGVKGMECMYSGYEAEYSEELIKLAGRFGICPTGGSDWHGAHKPHIEMASGMHGELSVPYSVLERLKEKL